MLPLGSPLAGRKWLAPVAPLENGLVMELLRYADELREPTEYFDEVPTARSQSHSQPVWLSVAVRSTPDRRHPAVRVRPRPRRVQTSTLGQRSARIGGR